MKKTDLSQKARAALAEPQGVVPTDAELMSLMAAMPLHNDLTQAARWCCNDTGTGGATAGFVRVALNRSALDFARAVLARYGNTPRPVPVGKGLPEADDLTSAPHPLLGDGTEYFNDPPQKCCWWWDEQSDSWTFANTSSHPNPRYTHWLPATALPLPEAGHD